MKCLLLSIYTNPAYRKCANGGPSEFYDQALVIGRGIPEIFEAGENPVFMLQRGNLPGCAKLVPQTAGPQHTMFGGSFGYSSDSRFTEAVEKITGSVFYGAVPIHDRIE